MVMSRKEGIKIREKFLNFRKEFKIERRITFSMVMEAKPVRQNGAMKASLAWERHHLQDVGVKQVLG